VRVAEAETLETEVQKLREDNADLKRRVSDIATLEASLRKADSRAETLEEKAYI
jgi:homeobox protein cut-like